MNQDLEQWEQFLCSYRDEAQRSRPILLRLKGTDFRKNVSSREFVNRGIEIYLGLNESKGQIKKVRFGNILSTNLVTLRAGIEFCPMGLFAAHVIQADENFDPEVGGVIRFGYLKRIFSLKSLSYILKRTLSILGYRRSEYRRFSSDMNLFWLNQMGQDNWGVFEILVQKDAEGTWRIYSTDQMKSGKELIAQFRVNKAGIVVGIDDMSMH